MSEKTNIQWCDSTVNFWSGCTKVSPGCTNCYAEARDRRQMMESISHWGKGAPRLKHVGAVKQAFSLNRKSRVCDNCGHGQQSDHVNPNISSTFCSGCRQHNVSFHARRVFSLSLGDWLDDEIPIEWLIEMLDTIRRCDNLIWILCTKRPENFFKLMQTSWRTMAHDKSETATFVADWEQGTKIPENIIILTSVENQEQADKRLPALVKIPARCHGLSLEPLLGPVNLDAWLGWTEKNNGLSKPLASALENLADIPSALDWLIVGGESGPHARQCDVNWIRQIVTQGHESGVSVFMKQMGQWLADGMRRCGHGVKAKKGDDPSEWPADLRVQQWPRM